MDTKVKTHKVKGEARAKKLAARRRAMPVNGKSVFVLQAVIAKKGREVGKK